MTEAPHTHEVPPGQPCPTCSRRVPYPKKKDSPTTKVISFRVPLDEVDAWKAALEEAAEHIGVSGKPFHIFHVLNAGIGLVLLGPSDLLEGG